MATFDRPIETKDLMKLHETIYSDTYLEQIREEMSKIYKTYTPCVEYTENTIKIIMDADSQKIMDQLEN